MSLSKNIDVPNPATKFFEWQASQGCIKWYDKEKGENQFIDLPFTFIVLDMLSRVTGFSEEDNGGIWSNEVRDTRKDVLTVRTKRGVKDQGLYQAVKNVKGARYTRSVYIAYKNGDDALSIGNIQMTGACNSAWIEFCKQNKVYGSAVKIVRAEDQKNGAVKFKSPVFELIPASEATIAEAVELDKELQVYLDTYLGREQEVIDPTTYADDEHEYMPDTDQEPPEYVEEW